MPRYFDRRRAASALVVAFFQGSRVAAARSGVSQRSIQAWKSKLLRDNELRDIYDHLMSEVLRDWAAKLPEVLESTLDFLNTAAREADPCDPDSIEAVTKALATVSEVYSLQLDLRSRGLDGWSNSQNREAS